LLWLWHKPTAAAPIQPLAWEPLYATGAALKKRKKEKKKKIKEKKERKKSSHFKELVCISHSYTTDMNISEENTDEG